MAGRQFNENNANVPSQDSADNVQERDVVGNKTDTSASPSGTTSLVAITKKIYDEVVSMSDASELFGKSGPSSVEIDDDATYALELYDVGDTVPTTAEITPGNYQIDRVRNAALTNIVASTPASEATGKIYCSEVFATGDGWAVGDLVLVTFSGGSIVQTGSTTVLPNAYFYSRITREEDIESKVDVIDGYHDIPVADVSTNSQIRDVVGNKTDGAQTTVGTTRSIIAYIKGLLNQVAKIPKSDAAVTWNSTALQSIQDEAEDALEGENLDHLQAVTTVAADMTAEVADGSVISRMLSKTSDTSTYDPTTDAQEMISDKLGGFSGDGGVAQDDSTKASLDLAHTDLDNIKTETDKLTGGEYAGTVSAGTAAKTLIKEITTSTRVEIKGIWLDLTLLVTAGATIELEHKIDGTNYRVFETDSWALADDDGVLISGFTINNDFKIGITGGEAAGVSIPYNIVYQNME